MSGLLSEISGYLSDRANWIGEAGLINRALDHLWISLAATLLAAVLILPLALYLAHHRRAEFLATSLVNMGRAIPAFGIIGLALPISIALGWGLGFWPTFVALVALAMPPIFTNTYTGVLRVRSDVVEAARGMGLKGGQVLTQIEIPLAMPLIWTGIRVSAVQVAATATLGAVVGWGGLGRYLIDGFAQGDDAQIVVGALAVALLALLIDGAFAMGERFLPGEQKADRFSSVTA
ncbi:MAG: ABC transporter permease subunit [Acidimicrobiia bacterium]|nr:ABC transporter permease subunit [Acidimicrobiia bacterium]